MDHSKEILSLLDLLDLDEELVDYRLRSIIDRSHYSNVHLTNALQLLQYKHLINLKDQTECENTEELDFTVKLIKNIHPDIIENVCKIIISVLRLKASTVVKNAEHLLQQILPSIDFTSDKLKSDDEDDHRSLLNFKVCDSVLDAVISLGLQIDLTFIDVPLEKVICHPNERVKIHFITSTVPKIFKGIIGFNILDRVWNYVKELRDIDVALKVLSCLSEYYLPAVDVTGRICYESEIVYYHEFWRITLSGLMSNDFTYRKISVYLSKKAIDYLAGINKNVNVELGGNILFSWNSNTNVKLKKQWDNFFILIDSLEEKQSNIVLPSLQLFEAVNEMPNCWVDCAFNLGLKHDNSQVRLKCIEHRLKRTVNSVTEATVLLQALGDINFYESTHDAKVLKENVTEMMMNKKSLVNVLQAIPEAKLSPVPLFHLTDVLAEIDLQDPLTLDKENSELITEIIKSPCNIIALRKAIHINIAQFVGKSCKGLDWDVLAKVFSLLQVDTELEDTQNHLVTILENKLTNREVTVAFFKSFINTLADIDFGLSYLDKHVEELHLFIEIIRFKIQTVKNIVDRQYSNKLDCLHDVLILSKILNKCEKEKSIAKDTINKILMAETKGILLKYVFCLLSSDVVCTVDESRSLSNCAHYAVDEESKVIFIQLYKSSVMLLRDSNIELEKAALCMLIINNLTANKEFASKFKHEMLSVEEFIDLIKIFEKRKDQKAQSVGRLKNIFYEKHSETVNCILENEDLKLDRYLIILVDYHDNIMECGGYGCLYWILKIINKIIHLLSDDKGVKFNINQFINRTWIEIEELKNNNNNYSPCMEEFIHLITHEALLEKSELNNIVILYCNKVIEYGPIKNNPLYYLAKKLDKKDIIRHCHLVLVLSDLLFYSPVSRKDQRIIDNLAVEIIRNPKYAIKVDDMDLHFNFEIQLITVVILSRIQDSKILAIISSIITNRIDDIFKHKVRYHGNSQLHRTIQTGLQHLLFILLLNHNVDSKRILDWCVYLLGKLPHQQSVRVCLEWYITLCFYIENRPVNKQLLDLLKSKNVPVLSQFIIMYWLVKHKISNNTITGDEYEYVLDTLLSNTIGQMFNVRLNAQYLSKKLYELRNIKGKYDYTIEVIDKALTENAKDKNLMKLKEDYFVHEFDAIGNLTPYFLYHILPILCDSNNGETDDIETVSRIVKEIDINVSDNDDAFMKEWTRFRVTKKELDKIELDKHFDRKDTAELEKMNTLQKKYIPWKNMSDVNAYETTKKRETTSKLIVVASLIDKLPNLGGMARTSEIFGVQTYVIDSLRHLQDKQFQGLSVSAERWIDIEEIRPGQALKDYLNKKKAEGYVVVAAEQTSTGSKLQTFKFPKKTLLLLGHEKEGIPCDLLPMMDHCVEIPQQGFVRSLNVHVTAAIFVWEYARQNLL